MNSDSNFNQLSCDEIDQLQIFTLIKHDLLSSSNSATFLYMLTLCPHSLLIRPPGINFTNIFTRCFFVRMTKSCFLLVAICQKKLQRFSAHKVLIFSAICWRLCAFRHSLFAKNDHEIDPGSRHPSFQTWESLWVFVMFGCLVKCGKCRRNVVVMQMSLSIPDCFSTICNLNVSFSHTLSL